MKTIKIYKFLVTCDESLSTAIYEENPGEVQTILVATDWKLGENLANEGKTDEASKTGFIGKGFNKIAIYVCVPFFCRLELGTAYACLQFRGDLKRKNMHFFAYKNTKTTHLKPKNITSAVN